MKNLTKKQVIIGTVVIAALLLLMAFLGNNPADSFALLNK